MAGSFQRHARNVSLLTLTSRVTGLARDASISRVLGAGGLTDAFLFAFMIPNLFRRLFGEGVLSAIFLPAYARLVETDPPTAAVLARRLVVGLTLALGGLSLLGAAILLAVSASRDHGSPALWLAAIMLPYMPMVCAVAVLGAMLQVRDRFGPTAAAPLILNLALIAAIVGGWLVIGPDADRTMRLRHLGVAAASVLVAGGVQVAWSLRALGPGAWRGGGAAAARPHLQAIVREAGPILLGLGVLQVNTLLDGLIASYPSVVGPTIAGHPYPLEAGAMATVSFAQRLYQFPLGVFGIAIATAIFPVLARQRDDQTAFATTVRRGLRLVLFIGLPASVGLVLVREPLTAVVFEGGSFAQGSTDRVARALLGYAAAVWAYSMVHVLARAFYARGEARTPMLVALGVVGLNVGLNLTLIWTPLEEAGLAWSTAICSIVQAIVLTRLLRRRLGPMVDRSVVGSWVRTVLVATLVAAATWAAGRLVPGETGDGWSAALLRLLVMVTAGVAAGLVVSRALRMPELGWALGRGDVERLEDAAPGP